MAFKSLFGAKKKPKVQRSEATEDADSVEDLIVLERYDEAEERLKDRLHDHPKDLHAHLRLAEVYMETGQGGKALDEYGFVADEYARDGFYDKAIALLSKAARMAPLDENLKVKLAAFRQAKRLEHKRNAAVHGLQNNAVGEDASFSPVELQGLWPKLVRSPIVERLGTDQVQRFFTHVRVERKRVGEDLAREGQRGEEMYVLASGKVVAQAAVPGKAEVELQTFGNGDVLGDKVLLERSSWPAHYRVAENATLFVLDRPAIEAMMTGDPDPRRFLEALRFQEKDAMVMKSVKKLRAKS